MLASTNKARNVGWRSNSPEKIMRATSGTVFAPDLLVAARGRTAAGSKRRSFTGPSAWKLPMWRATGTPASAARAQKGSSAVDGSTVPAGNAEISTPRKPRRSAHSSSTMASSTPVAGMIAWAYNRVGAAAQNSNTHSL